MTRSGRNFVFYFAWSRPREIHVDLAELENRFPTMIEARRSLWPVIPEFRGPQKPPQDIEPLLDQLILPRIDQCIERIELHTGRTVSVVQRQIVTSASVHLNDLALDKHKPCTLVILSFDHFRTSQTPTPAEVDWVCQFLDSSENCLVICPHHDVGASDRHPAQQAEFFHHGDPDVPAQDRVGGYGRALLKALGFPIENQFGLKPLLKKDGEPADLQIDRHLDRKGILKDVTTFTGHPHLPHYWVPPDVADSVDVLARQLVDVSAGAKWRANHPFLRDDGNKQFNAMLQLRRFAGTLLVCDVTLWLSPLQGGKDSLPAFWSNMACM